ncbi:M20/M25/M40 family metallo-hydrolase [Streptococcus cristatus]|uniref:M20/M25/M40 family metallo-hydrolase n=1 Tax=Streptococcus cristatus TaxID=45634 RepID=UPI000781A998|nr:M20/M25/M40 family metallo-hydrolase [Streptococcus cristatus]
MKQYIQDIFDQSMAIESFTHTSSERKIEAFLQERIGEIPYFQEHPEQFGCYQIPNDFYGRSVNWALVKRDTADTVIIFHHHDTVDIEDFGSLKDWAFDNQALKEKLPSISSDSDLLADIASDKWQFGRGSCDMKAALALQLGAVERYSQTQSGQANLLYLSVGDEESYSQGMRAATALLAELKERFQLHYLLAVDSEPFESQSAEEKVLHVGTVGKLMPVVVTQGILSHMKEPLKGINALSLLAKVAEKIDLNPALSDMAYGERSPLPSWSYLRDLKDNYDVSTVLRAAGYFSVLYLEKSPSELLATIKNLSQEAVEDFYQNYCQLQKVYEESKHVPKPRVLTYQELLQECQEKIGFKATLQQIYEEAQQALQEGASYQEISIQNIQKVLDFYDRKEALVVLAIAPPYYPSMNCRRLSDSPISIEKVVQLYGDFLDKEAGCQLQVDEFFMGICDLSYCALEKPAAEYQDLIASMPVPENLYHLDFPEIVANHIPGINLGPWGKDLHQLTERVYEQDMLETIPNFLLYLLENAQSFKV